MSNWTVYITDDQTLFRKGMARLVRRFKKVTHVEEAENGKELLDLLKKKVPNVILMDLEMPMMDGIEATEKVLAKYPEVKIIVLSMHDSQRHIFHLMELGAHAFLLKNAEPEEVEKAIESVIINDFYQNKLVVEALRKGTTEKNKTDFKTTFGSSRGLSDREKEILLLICDQLTTKEIANLLFISEKTVENHRGRMMEKLGVRNTVGLVRYAYEHGLIS